MPMSNFTPAWFKKGFFNESLFCDDFLSTHQLLYSNGAFFTPDGRMVDPMPLRCEIFEMMREYVGANLAKKVTNVVDVLKLAAQVEDFPPVTDRIALANGTLYLDGTFQEGKPEIVRNRLPVKYDPKAPQPVHWLRFLSDLLYLEDIPTVQEFIGYCLIPSNKGQRMMVIKGNGGEGKSQIGVVLSRLFGCNMKDGSIGQSYRGLFSARTQFYDNFNKFLSYKQEKETAKIGKLLDENYRLSVEMSEYKQVIFDILSPLTEQAEKELLADEPLKDQIMAMRKMSGTVQSIMNLYSRKHALDGMRIDMKMAELKKELEAAKKLPAVTGYDEEQKNYYSFLTSVESFMKDMQKARDKGSYSDEDYNAISEAYEYGLSVI